MNPERVREEFEAESARFDRLVPLDSDPLVILLKTHLLIEEQLFEIISSGTSEPAYVARARLTFAQALQLAKAIAGPFIADDIYETIRRLNSLRNELAHDAEAAAEDAACAPFLEWCCQQARFAKVQARLVEVAKLAEVAKLPKLPSTVLLHVVLGKVWGYLTGVRDALRVVREHQPLPNHGHGSSSKVSADERRAKSPLRRP